MDNDVVFRRTGLSIGEVAGTWRNQVFGFEPYNNPKADFRYRISCIGTAEVKKPR